MKRWLTIVVLAAGFVLPQSVTFGQTKEKTKAEAAQTAAEEGKEATEKEPTDAEKIAQLLKDKKLDMADALIGDLDPSSAQADSFRAQLARAYAMERNYDGAVGQYEKQLKAEMAKENFAPMKVVSTISLLRLYLPRAERADDVKPMIEEAMELLSKNVDRSKASRDLEALLRLRQTMSYTLRSEGKKEDAESILQDDLELTKGLYAAEESEIAASLYAAAMRNLMPTLTDSADREALLTKHQTLTSSLAEKGSPDMAVGYMQAALSEVSRSVRSDPEKAEAMLADLKKFMDHHSENEKIAPRLKSYERSIASYEGRLESARKLLAMIGQPAPEMAAGVNWVGVDQPVDTNGKVVLLDFWALWCGPCIATFPHLKHLSDEYGDQGLQIVGVTRYYNYTWNEETGRPERGDREADPNPDVENEVLKKFMASHDLTHPTVVVPKESTMHKDYGVSGIPHVALIDQQGRIQMVKVGSGEANAQAIEAKIRELLGLSDSEETAAGE